MANGYEPGDYLGQFLTQLPQIYQAQQNMKLQEERLNLQKQTAMQNQEYRQRIAQQNKQQQTYNNWNQAWGAVAGNPDAEQLLLKQHPLVKDNPEMIDVLNEGFDIRQSMQSQVFALNSMEPAERMLVGRELLQSPYMTQELYTTANAAIEKGRGELEFTMDEFKNTESYWEYLRNYSALENLTMGTGEGAQQKYEDDRDALITNLKSIKAEGLAEYQLAQGKYPESARTYNNVEDIDGDYLDEVLADFSAPFTERYPFSPDETIDTSTQIQTAGKAIGSKTEIQPKEIKPTLQTLEAEIESLEDRKKILRGSPATLQEFKAVESTLSEKRRELIGLELEESRKKGEKLTEEKYQKLSKASGVPVKVLKERAKNTKNWEKFLNMFKRGW